MGIVLILTSTTPSVLLQDIYRFRHQRFLSRQSKPFDLISCFRRSWTSLALSPTCVSLKRSLGRESWSAVMTCLSTCRAVLQRMKKDPQLMYVSIYIYICVKGVDYTLQGLFLSMVDTEGTLLWTHVFFALQVQKHAISIIPKNVL